MSRHFILPSLFVLALGAGAAMAAPAEEAARPDVAPAPSAAPRAPRLTAEQKALLAVQDEGRARVAELVRTMAGLPDGPALRALEQKVHAVKQEARIQFLRVKIAYALERGDLATAHEAEQIIDRMLHPRPAVARAVTRPEPGRTAGEGGRP
jgi:hypothetical protein